MATINDSYQTFIDSYNVQLKTVEDASVLSQANVNSDGHSFSLNMLYQLVESAFMRIFLEWEIFLETSFIAYLQNENDLKGNTFASFAHPTDDSHAYSMLKGTKNYPDWTNIEDVKNLANIYFQNFGAYACLVSLPAEFAEIKTIRNRISHISANSTRAYNNVLSRKISQNNLEPGDFLTRLNSNNITYFTEYSELLKNYVEAICNK